MFVDYTSDQKALRKQYRAYFSGLMKPEYKRELRGGESGELYKKLIRQQGSDGMLAVGWPQEYGGRGLNESEQLIRYEEAMLADAPIPFVTLNTVGPTIITKGTEEQKKRFLPGIARGELNFCIGYTEPGAGTDLASLSTSAVLQDDHYVVNGSKIFTSGAEGADYVWLAARTDAKAPKHKGITILIVDTRDAGFSCAPIHTVGGLQTSVTYYDNVKVPRDMIVGKENGGWSLITEQLNYERLGLAAWGIQAWKIFRDALQWARSTKSADGLRVIDDPAAQRNIAEIYCYLEAMRVMNARMAFELDRKRMDVVFPSALKVYSAEIVIEVCRLLMDMVGPHALISSNSESAFLNGNLEHEYRRATISTFGGGVVEVLRGMVATIGLGMPQHR